MSHSALLIAKDATIGLRLNGNGDRNSVKAFLRYAEYAQLPSINADDKWISPFITMLQNFFRDNNDAIRLETVDPQHLGDKTDYDNGIYVLEDYEIVDRINSPADTSPEHRIHDRLLSIDSTQPLVNQLGDFLFGMDTPITSIKIGDQVFLPRLFPSYEYPGRYRIHTVLGFADNDPFNPLTSNKRFKGRPYVDMFNNQDNAVNPQSYITTDTVRVLSYPIYVISFAPANDLHGAGGFDWLPATTMNDGTEALDTFYRHVKDSRDEGGSHIVRLLRITDPNITADMQPKDVTDYIDADIDRWESKEHALKQFVPPNADADHVPTGGADEHITHPYR